MVITKIVNLGKGIRFELNMQGTKYSLIINNGGKTWFTTDTENEWAGTGVSDEKLIKKLEKAWKQVVFLPQS